MNAEMEEIIPSEEVQQLMMQLHKEAGEKVATTTANWLLDLKNKKITFGALTMLMSAQLEHSCIQFYRIAAEIKEPDNRQMLLEDTLASITDILKGKYDDQFKQEQRGEPSNSTEDDQKDIQETQPGSSV